MLIAVSARRVNLNRPAGTAGACDTSGGSFRTPIAITFCIEHLTAPAKAAWEKKIRRRNEAVA